MVTGVLSGFRGNGEFPLLATDARNGQAANPHPFGDAQGKLCRTERDKDGAPGEKMGLRFGLVVENGRKFLGKGRGSGEPRFYWGD